MNNHKRLFLCANQSCGKEITITISSDPPFIENINQAMEYHGWKRNGDRRFECPRCQIKNP